eukprot:scaffold9715_cov113-Isochrysis_galbana.AAC.9
MVPPDASPEEQMRLVQQAMEEDAKNKQRAADEEARRAAAAKAERIARSDVWCYVLSGAGSEELNGPFHRDGSAVRNGARVYTNGAGFVMSREVINGGEGWIIGRAPKAYYGFQTKDTLAPETGWSVQEHGKAPSPTVAAMEPAMAVEAAKQAGNAAFKAGQHADAIQQYGEALRIARACVGAYGLSDELLAHGALGRGGGVRAKTAPHLLAPRAVFATRAQPLPENARGRQTARSDRAPGKTTLSGGTVYWSTSCQPRLPMPPTACLATAIPPSESRPLFTPLSSAGACRALARPLPDTPTLSALAEPPVSPGAPGPTYMRSSIRAAVEQADADRALELDPCFVKAYVRKAKALYAREQWDAAAAALRDALDVAPGTKEVLALQVSRGSAATPPWRARGGGGGGERGCA